jgi:hypothetical protein
MRFWWELSLIPLKWRFNIFFTCKNAVLHNIFIKNLIFSTNNSGRDGTIVVRSIHLWVHLVTGGIHWRNLWLGSLLCWRKKKQRTSERERGGRLKKNRTNVCKRWISSQLYDQAQRSVSSILQLYENSEVGVNLSFFKRSCWSWKCLTDGFLSWAEFY